VHWTVAFGPVQKPTHGNRWALPELERIDKALDDLILRHEALHLHAERLRSIPGIGKGTVPFLICLILGRNFLQARQLGAYVGITPREHRSGTSVHAPPRLCKRGDRLIHKQLWWPVIQAMRHPDFAPWVEKLREKGKPEKAMICAVMRKFIQEIYPGS
jgi:transposase